MSMKPSRYLSRRCKPARPNPLFLGLKCRVEQQKQGRADSLVPSRISNVPQYPLRLPGIHAYCLLKPDLPALPALTYTNQWLRACRSRAGRAGSEKVEISSRRFGRERHGQGGTVSRSPQSPPTPLHLRNRSTTCASVLLRPCRRRRAILARIKCEVSPFAAL